VTRGRLLFCVLVLASFFLVTCRRDAEPDGRDCGEATTIDEMMEWVFFRTGSYWIYEEQNSGAIDTMTVYYDHHGVSPTGNREFYMKMESSLDGSTYEYWFNDAWSSESSLRPGCTVREVDCEKYAPNNYSAGNHVFPFPLFIGARVVQWQGLNSSFSIITEYAESDSIGGNLYHGVYTISQEYSPQHDYQPSMYSIAKNVGIVEKVIPNTLEHWKLIEFQIIQ